MLYKQVLQVDVTAKKGAVAAVFRLLLPEDEYSPKPCSPRPSTTFSCQESKGGRRSRGMVPVAAPGNWCWVFILNEIALNIIYTLKR